MASPDGELWPTVAASAFPLLLSENPLGALDRAGRERIRDAFANAAGRTGRLDIAAAQIHAAHCCTSFCVNFQMFPTTSMAAICKSGSDFPGTPSRRFGRVFRRIPLSAGAFPGRIGRRAAGTLMKQSRSPERWKHEDVELVTFPAGGCRLIRRSRLGPAIHRLPLSTNPREETKKATMIAMLQRKNGATITEIVEETGSPPHTVRGAFAGALKKKVGLTIVSERVEARGLVPDLLIAISPRLNRTGRREASFQNSCEEN